MPDRVVVFADAGFLKSQGSEAAHGIPAAQCTVDARSAVKELGALAVAASGEQLLRVYWYDGAFPRRDPRARAQTRYFDSISLTPRLTVRLGTIKQREPAWLRPLRRALAGPRNRCF